MLMPAETIRQGLSHENVLVRNACLAALSHMRDDAAGAIPLAMESIERYGWRKAFEWPHMIAELPLDETSISWLLERLAGDFFPADRRLGFEDALSEVSRDLLRRQRERLAAAELKDSSAANKLAKRLEILDQSPDAAWEELTSVANDALEFVRTKNRFPHDLIAQGEHLAEVVAEGGAPFHERTLDLLRQGAESLPNQKNVEEVPVNCFLVGLMVPLAAEMGLVDAIPSLLRFLAVDWDWICEAFQTAIAKYNAPDYFAQLRPRYEDMSWRERLFAIDAFSHWRSPGVVQQIIELMSLEPEDDLMVNLGNSLAYQFDDEQIDRLTQLITDDADDPERLGVQSVVVGHALLAGLQPPNLDSLIRRELRALEARKQRQRSWEIQTRGPALARLKSASAAKKPVRVDAPQPPLPKSIVRSIVPKDLRETPQEIEADTVVRSGPRINRNDFCPCGSGKKYKKCCMRHAVE